jgi:hypothetical protein
LKKSIGSSGIVAEETNNGGEKPMLYLDDIKVEFESQGFKGTHIGISPDKDKSVLFFGERKANADSSVPLLWRQCIYL